MNKPEKKNTLSFETGDNYPFGYNQCIDDQQAYENSIEGLPERKEVTDFELKYKNIPICPECDNAYENAYTKFIFNELHDIAKVLLGQRDQEILELKNVGILARKIVDGLQAEIKVLKSNKPSVVELEEEISDCLQCDCFQSLLGVSEDADYKKASKYIAQAIHDYKRGEV